MIKKYFFKMREFGGFSGQGNQDSANRKPGDINIDHIPNSGKRSNKETGEEIDYEELD